MYQTFLLLGPALLVGGLACLLYIGLIVNVARMRQRCGVYAPATSGPPEFERALRAQLNMNEQLTPFLACLMTFAVTLQPIAGAVLGGIWLFGRVLFTIGYLKDSPLRLQGFSISMLSLALLALGAVAGAGRLILTMAGGF